MGDVVDLSVGAPSPPQVSSSTGDALPEEPKPKRTRSTGAKAATSTPDAATVPTGLDELDEPLPAVTMDQVRVVVMSAGVMLGMAFGDEDAPDVWRFTDAELAGLVPPLTSVINRRPALQQAVRRSDEVTIALVLAGYTGRNLDKLRTARKARAQREGEVEGGLEGEADAAPGPGAAGGAGAGRGAGWPAGPGGRVPGATG